MSDITTVDTDRLERTQQIREKIIESMLDENGKVVFEASLLSVLNKTLSDMDKQVFSKAQQKALEKEVDNQAAMREVVAAVFAAKMRGEVISAPGEVLDGYLSEEPDLGDTDDIPKSVLEQGVSDETYEEFRERMGD